MQKRVVGLLCGRGPDWNSPDDRWSLVIRQDLKPVRLNLQTLEDEDADTEVPSAETAWFSPNGRYLALLEFSPNGRSLAVRRSSDFRRVPGISTNPAYVANFHPDGQSIAVAHGAGVDWIDISTGKTLGSVPLRSAVAALQFSPDGQRLLVTRTGGRAAFEYDLTRPGMPLAATYGDAVSGLDTTEGRPVSGDVVRLLKRGGPRGPRETKVKGAPFEWFRRGYAGELVLLQTEQMTLYSQLTPGSPGTIRKYRAQGIDSSGRFGIDYRGERHTIVDLSGKVPSWTIPAPRSLFWALWAADPAGKAFVATLDNTHLGVYEIGTGRLIRRVEVTEPATLIRFSDDGRHLAATGSMGAVFVWNSAGGKPVASGRLGSGSASSISFSKDGKRLAVSYESGALGTLNLETGKGLSFQGNVGAINDIAWSHDGSRIVTTGGNRTVRIWDMATGRDLGVIGRLPTTGFAVWFLPGDRTLCCIDGNGVVRSWQTEERP